MKIQRIVNICKKSGFIYVFEDVEGTQWIGDGGSLYPMYGFPRFDQDSFCKTYDINTTQQNKIIFRYERGMPSQINCSDAVEGETQTGRIGEADIAISGRTYTPCMTQKGISFFNREYLRPLSDEPASLDIYERTTPDGKTYFAIKTGFMLKAVVIPTRIITKEFVQGLKALAVYCEETFNRDAEPETDIAGQRSLYTNEVE